MKDRQNALDAFLNRLYQLEKALDDLDDFAYELSEQYDRHTFAEQEKLSRDVLENLIIAATHETASQLVFTGIIFKRCPSSLRFGKHMRRSRMRNWQKY